MKIKQLEWNELQNSKGIEWHTPKMMGLNYSIEVVFTDNWYTLYSLLVRNNNCSKLGTSLNVDELKILAQQHFENEIKQYLEV